MNSREHRVKNGIRKAHLAALVAVLIGAYVGLTKAAPPEQRIYKDCKILFVQSSSTEGIPGGIGVNHGSIGMDADIYCINADGSEKRNLTNSPHHGDAGAAWSPDGKKIAFLSLPHPALRSGRKMGAIPLELLWQSEKNAQIYVMNADGSEKKKLADNAQYPGRPTWSPDGRKIVSGWYTDVKFGFCVMNADGSEPKYFPDSASCCWSPDGTKLAFVSWPDWGNMEIYVMNADGSEQKNLTNNPGRDDFPAWSPDGQKILFTSDRDTIQLRVQQEELQVVGYVTENEQVTATKEATTLKVWEMYVINVDSGEQRRLTKTDSIENAATMYVPPLRWSPDGKKILFRPDIVSTDPLVALLREIHVINADGSGRKKLADNTVSCSWSPDGGKIILTSFAEPRDSGTINREMYIMNPDGTERKKLADNGEDVSWSPDGKKIAFISVTKNGNRDVYIVNPDGTELTNLTNSPESESDPQWSPFLASED
jgi:Tol biopolymer transport system component